MKDIRIGEQTVRVKGSPLTLLYYRQEFDADVFGDVLRMIQTMGGLSAALAVKDGENELDISRLNLAGFDTVAILQIIWAMARTADHGRPFPSFVDWLASFESFDISDGEMLRAVMEEAASGFFRAGLGKFKQR